MSEEYKLLQEIKKNNPKVKYDFYREYFVDVSKPSFGRRKSDTCAKCDNLLVKIQCAIDEGKKKRFIQEKELHIKKAETFYESLKEKENLSRQDSTVEVISMDFQQNMPLTVTPSGDVFYKTQLWVYNFCINIGSSGKSYFYTYDESIGGKGQNKVISILYHFVNCNKAGY